MPPFSLAFFTVVSTGSTTAFYPQNFSMAQLLMRIHLWCLSLLKPSLNFLALLSLRLFQQALEHLWVFRQTNSTPTCISICGNTETNFQIFRVRILSVAEHVEATIFVSLFLRSFRQAQRPRFIRRTFQWPNC